MNAHIKILTGILLVLLSSCEKESDITLNTSAADLIVVEGIITNEKTNHRIVLTRAYADLNGIPEPVHVDTIFITDGSTVYPLIETPTGSGEYFTPLFRAVFGKAYLLVFFYQGKRYTAIDSPPPGEPLDPIALEQAEDAMYKLNLKDSGISASYTSYHIDWYDTPSCLSDDECYGEVVYYDLKTTDVHEIYKPQKEDLIFPVGSRIVRNKYSVSQRYRDFLRSVLSETEWRGGIFDIERANALTNLSEGAIGYFAASTVVTDTTFVK